jgi:RNA polymerase sigma factor (sigma-70 family)
MATSRTPSYLPPDQLLLKNLPFIEKAVAQSCRRSHFSPEEAKDFASCVHVKLIEDDYRVFRQFKGESSLRTYLATVIKWFLLDYRDHLWGKWRESAEAKRLGPVAERLERLLVREEYTFDQAVQILQVNEKLGMTEAELEDLRTRLPQRAGRRVVGEEVLQGLPSREPRPDEALEEKDTQAECRRILMKLHRALDGLPDEDRVFVKLAMEMKVADIARAQGLEQKPLYRRVERICKELRKALEWEGVRREDVQKILGCLQPDGLARPEKTG